MATQFNSVGDWVSQFRQEIYHQPNDDDAVKAFEAKADPSILVRTNHDHFTFDQYRGLIKQYRGTHTVSLLSNSTILEWHDAEKGGTVGHLTKTLHVEKATGKKEQHTTLIITTVKWINGKRMVTEITEVFIEEEA
ncbi:hypothetical protein MPH_05265 [Macrophomina phaseolina MS6]|uniref:Uncharacterized protein n=1 Tax=Macrophomina phaseolina (strain MS6) TaxID=1126212 RepID=K2RXW1_MACPH|nr:hypothetical protein MPH_05265 [Macrophomina phaseolina MS6]